MRNVDKEFKLRGEGATLPYMIKKTFVTESLATGDVIKVGYYLTDGNYQEFWSRLCDVLDDIREHHVRVSKDTIMFDPLPKHMRIEVHE